MADLVEQIHITRGKDGKDVLLDANFKPLHPMANAKSECGPAFDQHMLEHSAFPFDSMKSVSHVNTVWAGRKLSILPVVNGQWVEGSIIDMIQSNSGPYMGSTRWTFRIKLTAQAWSILGPRGAEAWGISQLNFLDAFFKEPTLEVELKVHRCDLLNGGTFKRPSVNHSRKFLLWRNAEKSIDSMGEPFSAWAVLLKDGRWFLARTDPDEGRTDEFVAERPEGYTERHLVEEDCLDAGAWDEELDYYLALSGRLTSVSIDELQPHCEDSHISFKWICPPSPPPRVIPEDWWPGSGHRAKLVGLSRADLNGTIGELGSFSEDRQRWPFHPEGGGPPMAVKLLNIEHIDVNIYPFTMTGAGTEAQPWAVPPWPVDQQLSAAGLHMARAQLTEAYPPPVSTSVNDQYAVQYAAKAQQHVAGMVLRLMENRDSDRTKIMSRRFNKVEANLLGSPLRFFFGGARDALGMADELAKKDRAAAIALCLAYVAVLPQRLQCLETLLATRYDSCMADDVASNVSLGPGPGRAAAFVRVFTVDLLNKLGELHEDADGDSERMEAILFYERCLTHTIANEPGKPHRAVGLANLGLALKRGGHLGEALEKYDAEARMTPGDGFDHENREILLKEIMQWKGTAAEPWAGGSTSRRPIVVAATIVDTPSDEEEPEPLPQCLVCAASVERLKKCAGCLQRLYCSPECQVAHWEVHKTECKRMKAERRAAERAEAATDDT